MTDKIKIIAKELNIQPKHLTEEQIFKFYASFQFLYENNIDIIKSNEIEITKLSEIKILCLPTEVLKSKIESAISNGAIEDIKKDPLKLLLVKSLVKSESVEEKEIPMQQVAPLDEEKYALYEELVKINTIVLQELNLPILFKLQEQAEANILNFITAGYTDKDEILQNAIKFSDINSEEKISSLDKESIIAAVTKHLNSSDESIKRV